MKLNLMVLYTEQLDKMRDFYEALGFKLIEEHHGSGPTHYSVSLDDDVVFEIYPTNRKGEPRRGPRIGFQNTPVKEIRQRYADYDKQSNVVMGLLEQFIVSDPDGNTLVFVP